MKWNTIVGAVVLSVALCGQSFGGGGLLNKVLGHNGIGCCDADPSCGCEAEPVMVRRPVLSGGQDPCAAAPSRRSVPPPQGTNLGPFHPFGTDPSSRTPGRPERGSPTLEQTSLPGVRERRPVPPP